MENNTTPASPYGPRYDKAAQSLMYEIGNEAARLMDIGWLPNEALPAATETVQKRRAAIHVSAHANPADNIVPLRK